jgi:hypothetical protein
MGVSAIPTMYDGCQFRSRLEARWAAFFDLCGWRWEYEPLDLNGYIPDFILAMKSPVLVEVKPALADVDYRAAFKKIEDSGWTNEAIVVGASIAEPSPWLGWGRLGLFAIEHWPASHEEPETRFWGHSEASLFRCRACNRMSFCSRDGEFSCRTSGCYEGDHYLSSDDEGSNAHLWREAGNRVQWRGARVAVPYLPVNDNVEDDEPDLSVWKFDPETDIP